MRLRSMASLGLLLLAAAAAPADPCGPGVNTASIGQAETTGAPRDLGLPALSATEGSCDSSAAERSEMQRMRPDTGFEDAMHAVPPSDSLRPINQRGRAPDYR